MACWLSFAYLDKAFLGFNSILTLHQTTSELTRLSKIPQSHTIMANFQFSEIQQEGILSHSFEAKVDLIEDKVIQGRGEPYIKLLLSQDKEGPKISAIAVGDVYLSVKRFYKVGSVYTFKAGQFRTKLRQQEFQSWSTNDYDLWFNNTPSSRGRGGF